MWYISYALNQQYSYVDNISNANNYSGLALSMSRPWIFRDLCLKRNSSRSALASSLFALAFIFFVQTKHNIRGLQSGRVCTVWWQICFFSFKSGSHQGEHAFFFQSGTVINLYQLQLTKNSFHASVRVRQRQQHSDHNRQLRVICVSGDGFVLFNLLPVFNSPIVSESPFSVACNRHSASASSSFTMFFNHGSF